MESGLYGEAGKSSNVLSTDKDNLINFGGEKSIIDTDVPGDSNAGDDSVSVNKPTSSSVTKKEFTRVIDINNRYEGLDKGPYFVYVESTDREVNKLHPMQVGRILDGMEPVTQQKLLEVMSVGRNRVKIEVQDYQVANDLVVHPVFSENKLVAYVPTHCTQRKGVVRGVDTSFSDDFILRNIRSSVAVLGIKRLTKMVDDRANQGMLKEVPRQMIIVTFKGLTLPDYVYISRVRCPVETHIAPVIQCYNCLRYGHIKSQCKSHKRCRICGEQHAEDVKCDESKKRCIYCQSPDHSATSKNCPVYQNQRKIKFTMATNNMSFKEAEKAIRNPSFSTITQSNRFFVLNNMSEDFPVLSKRAPEFGCKPTASDSSQILKPSVLNHTQRQVNSPAKKRKKTSATGLSQPTRVHSEHHFCGPPIQHNPHTDNSSDFKSLLLDGIHDALNKLISSKDFTPSEYPEVDLIAKIREAINKVLDNCSSQLPSGHEDSAMEC